MGSAETQGDLWGRASEDWAGLQENQHAPLWEAMLDATGVSSGTRFFDAGCGSGGASLLARERGANVSGLDAAGPLIAIARDQVPDGDFHVGDLEELPFADDSFHSVIAASSIQYANDPTAAMRELSRVCTPEGKVAVGLWSTPDKVDFRVIFAAVRDALPEPPPGEGPFALSNPGKLEELALAAEMTVTGSGEVECPFVYPDFAVFWRAIVSGGPLQAAKTVLGEEKLEQAVAIAVDPYRTDDGGFRLENAFRYVVATPTA